MKAKHLIATTLLLAATANCRPSQKDSPEASSSSADSGKFESIDLGCQFEDITAQPKADSSLAMTAGSCANANQYYPMLLTQFDTNQDGQLTGAELVRSQGEYLKAQLLAIDTDDDGLCSILEISAWRQKNLKARLAKLPAKYKAACSSLHQDDSSCSSLYDKSLEVGRKKLEAEKQSKLAGAPNNNSSGMGGAILPGQSTDDSCVSCEQVVKVPVKVKVDVTVDVAQRVNYVNFDEECTNIDDTGMGYLPKY